MGKMGHFFPSKPGHPTSRRMVTLLPLEKDVLDADAKIHLRDAGRDYFH